MIQNILIGNFQISLSSCFIFNLFIEPEQLFIIFKTFYGQI